MISGVALGGTFGLANHGFP